MEDVKRILVVSRSTQSCKKAVHYGISLSRHYGARMYVLHVVHDPFSLEGWNLAIPSIEEEYRLMLEKIKQELDRLIASEKAEGLEVRELIRDGDPVDEVMKVIGNEHIDLMLMAAHEEGRVEHFLFGRSNEELVRKMPCSVLLVKTEVEKLP